MLRTMTGVSDVRKSMTESSTAADLQFAMVKCRKRKMAYSPNLDIALSTALKLHRVEVRRLEVVLEELLGGPVDPLDARGPRR